MRSGFYVANAELKDPEFLEKLEVNLKKTDPRREDLESGFSAHRLKAGQGLVIAYRGFSAGSDAIDDEEYEKLTVWLRRPNSIAGRQTMHFPDQGMIILSSGGSAWPRNDCSGFVKATVNVVPLDSGMRVQVNGTFEPMGNRHRLDRCTSRGVVMEFDVNQASMSDLTPWQGGPGSKGPYDETYFN